MRPASVRPASAPLKRGLTKPCESVSKAIDPARGVRSAGREGWAGMSDDDYYTIRTDTLSDLPARSRPRPLRAAMLFATAAVAMTVLVAPQLGERLERRQVAAFEGYGPLDDTVTGALGPARPSFDGAGLRPGTPATPFATRPSAPRNTYVVRRSVLSKGSVCIIRQDGSRSGAC